MVFMRYLIRFINCYKELTSSQKLEKIQIRKQRKEDIGVINNQQGKVIKKRANFT